MIANATVIVPLTKYPEKEIEIMPVLSKFYGIVIRMVFTRSFTAHFHAIYGQCELVVGIAPLRVIQGDAPGRVRDMDRGPRITWPTVKGSWRAA